jgi:hypothetical protein
MSGIRKRIMSNPITLPHFTGGIHIYCVSMNNTQYTLLTLSNLTID